MSFIPSVEAAMHFHHAMGALVAVHVMPELVEA